ncbi:MAG: GNAT family N-acetyltransferase [Thermoplasmatota archaeon]
MDDVEGMMIRNDIRPGDAGCLIHLHGTVYFEEYGFDTIFESYVADTFAEFLRHESERKRLWIVEKDGRIVGCIGIMERSVEVAQLRWLLLHPDVRGRGLGRKLMEDAIDFAKGCGYSSIFLFTESILKDAARLYELYGFKLVEESQEQNKWGGRFTAQRYEKVL